MLKLVTILLFCLVHTSHWAQILFDTTIAVQSIQILFESDQSHLRQDDSLVMVSFMDSVVNLGDKIFIIDAHTDADGSDIYNRNLSMRRTESVKNFMIERGIDSTIIVSSFYGEEQPISDNLSETGKRLNRRARLTLFRKVKLFNLICRVTDLSTDAILQNANVIVHSKVYMDTFRIATNGLYEVNIPLNVVIGIDASAQYYIDKSMMLKTNLRMAQDTLNIKLKKFGTGHKISFNEFYFVGSKAILLPKSNPELDVLYKLLNKNTDICVEIIGHVNYPNQPPVGKNSFEYNLSIARSKLIYTSLIEKGISSNRMFYSGRGNSEMIHPKARIPKDMKKNRRVEVVVNECLIVEISKNDLLDDRNYNFYKE